MKRKSLNEKHYNLVGIDGNAFSVMGYVADAMRQCKHSRDEINAYREDCMSGDYNHLLAVSAEMVDMLNNEQNNQRDYEPWDDEYESYKVKAKKHLDEDSLIDADDFNEDNFEETENDEIPYDVKKTLHYAIADALVKIWDEYGIEFTKKQAKQWLKETVKNFDWNSFSLTPYLLENKRRVNESMFNDPSKVYDADDLILDMEEINEPIYMKDKVMPGRK